MARSKTIFLSKIAISLLLFIFIKQPIVRLLLLVFVGFDGLKDLTFFVLVCLLILLNENYRYDFIPLGVVDKVTSKTVLVEKGLYRVCLYDIDYENGDILLFMGSKLNENDDEIRNNVLFQSEAHVRKIGSLRLRKWALKRIDSFDDDLKAPIKKIVLNDYADTEFNLGYGFCFYYVLLFIYRKKKATGLIACILYSLMFGFELKLLLFIIGFIIDLFKFDRVEKLSARVMVMAIINYHLFTNYSFMIGFIFSLMALMGHKKGSLLLAMAESWFFKRVSFFHLFALKVMMALRVCSFVLGILCFALPIFKPLFLVYLHAHSFVLSFDSYAVRGAPDLLILVLLGITIFILKVKNEYLKILIYCGLLILPLSEICPAVSFIDVGQGDAILISDYFGYHHVLIDTGSPFNYSKLQNYLYSKGIYRLDYLIISHDDADHSGNVENLESDFEIGTIVADKRDVRIGDVVLKNIDSGSYDNKNEDSLVYYLEYHGLSFLFTGDITAKTEMNIIKQKLLDSIDVLKVSHHGSDTATSDLFVSRTLPRFAVISTSGMYDHPKKEVLDTLKDYCVRTFITKRDGTVRFVLTPLKNFVKTEFANFVIID